jgi:hypothetical protein
MTTLGIASSARERPIGAQIQRAVAGYLDGCPTLFKARNNDEAMRLMNCCAVKIFDHANRLSDALRFPFSSEP